MEEFEIDGVRILLPKSVLTLYQRVFKHKLDAQSLSSYAFLQYNHGYEEAKNAPEEEVSAYACMHVCDAIMAYI